MKLIYWWMERIDWVELMESGPRSQKLRGKPTIHPFNHSLWRWLMDELMGGCSLLVFFGGLRAQRAIGSAEEETSEKRRTAQLSFQSLEWNLFFFWLEWEWKPKKRRWNGSTHPFNWFHQLLSFHFISFRFIPHTLIQLLSLLMRGPTHNEER